MLVLVPDSVLVMIFLTLVPSGFGTADIADGGAGAGSRAEYAPLYDATLLGASKKQGSATQCQ